MIAYYEETRYGFVYGAARIERTASLPEGGTIVSIFGMSGSNNRPSIEVYVSAKGRRIRVFSDGEEWKP